VTYPGGGRGGRKRGKEKAVYFNRTLGREKEELFHSSEKSGGRCKERRGECGCCVGRLRAAIYHGVGGEGGTRKVAIKRKEARDRSDLHTGGYSGVSSPEGNENLSSYEERRGCYLLCGEKNALERRVTRRGGRSSAFLPRCEESPSITV